MEPSKGTAPKFSGLMLNLRCYVDGQVQGLVSLHVNVASESKSRYNMNACLHESHFFTCLVRTQLLQKRNSTMLMGIAPFCPLMLSQRMIRIGHGGQDVCERHPEGCSSKVVWTLHKQQRGKHPTSTVALQSHITRCRKSTGEKVVQTGMCILHTKSLLLCAIMLCSPQNALFT